MITVARYIQKMYTDECCILTEDPKHPSRASLGKAVHVFECMYNLYSIQLKMFIYYKQFLKHTENSTYQFNFIS